MGKKIEEIFVPMQVDVSFQEVGRAIQDKGRFFGIFSYKNKKGELRYGELTIISQLNSFSKVSVNTIICHDITECKKKEQSLKESEEKFRSLAEESPNMIFINDRGRVVYTNKKLKK